MNIKNGIIKFNVKNRFFRVNVDENKIESIVLFGSYANREADSKSDMDFLVIVDECPKSYINKVKQQIVYEMRVPMKWIIVYTKSQFSKKCKSPGTFLWGVRVFGKVIFSRSNYLKNSYSKMPKNIDVKKTILEDNKSVAIAMKKLIKERTLKEDAINVLVFAIRDLCINICYLYGDLEIRKFEPLKKCLKFEDVHIPFTFREYEELYRVKKNYYNVNFNERIKGNPYKFIFNWYKKFIILSSEVLRIEEKMNKNL